MPMLQQSRIWHLKLIFRVIDFHFAVCVRANTMSRMDDSFFTQSRSEEYIIIHASSKYVGKSVSEIDLPEDIRNKYCVNIKRFPMLYFSLSLSLTGLTYLHSCQTCEYCECCHLETEIRY